MSRQAIMINVQQLIIASISYFLCCTVEYIINDINDGRRGANRLPIQEANLHRLPITVITKHGIILPRITIRYSVCRPSQFQVNALSSNIDGFFFKKSLHFGEQMNVLFSRQYIKN